MGEILKIIIEANNKIQKICVHTSKGSFNTVFSVGSAPPLPSFLLVAIVSNIIKVKIPENTSEWPLILKNYTCKVYFKICESEKNPACDTAAVERGMVSFMQLKRDLLPFINLVVMCSYFSQCCTCWGVGLHILNE